MEELETNINDNDGNQKTQSSKIDDDIFLVNKIEKYPSEFPVFPDQPIQNTDAINNINDESTNKSQNIQDQEETIWDHYDSLDIPFFDEPKPDISETIESEKLQLDDEFIQYLAEELERSTKKKPQLEEIEPSEEFIPVEEKGNYELIDLSKFPEQITQQNKEEQKPLEVKQNVSVDEKASSSFQEEVQENSDEKPINEIKEKKKRKIPIWVMITSVAVIVFAIATILSYNMFHKSLILNKPIKQKTIVEKPKEQESSIAQSNTIQIDSNQSIPEESSFVDTTKTIIEKKAEPTIVLNETKTEAKQSEPIKREKAINNARKTPLFATPKSEIKKDKIAQEKTILAENRQNLKESNSKIATNIDNAVYTIQVYSTPSREDAEQWKKELEKMNIPKAYISEQKIRDVIWYRVRFGEYPTREQAMQAAKQLGFSQMWVDRIK